MIMAYCHGSVMGLVNSQFAIENMAIFRVDWPIEKRWWFSRGCHRGKSMKIPSPLMGTHIFQPCWITWGSSSVAFFHIFHSYVGLPQGATGVFPSPNGNIFPEAMLKKPEGTLKFRRRFFILQDSQPIPLEHGSMHEIFPSPDACPMVLEYWHLHHWADFGGKCR